MHYTDEINGLFEEALYLEMRYTEEKKYDQKGVTLRENAARRKAVQSVTLRTKTIYDRQADRSNDTASELI